MELMIKCKDESLMPKYETSTSSGMDLKADIDEPYTLGPFERVLVPTGVYLALEEGKEAQVRARSGLAIKEGITLINGIGTIDSDYRGEIKVPLINLGNGKFTIKPGDRIAQLVIMRYEKVTQFKIVD